MKKLLIETYGCQMNVADSEVVAAIMGVAGYEVCQTADEADAVFLNTCSVRDNAEQKIISRLEFYNSLKRKGRRLIVGVLGCMAERVREELIEHHGVDLVAGPDSYLRLPDLIAQVEVGQKAIDVELSTTETYRDIVPQRICGPHIGGFVSIMRGCNNFCHYCIVPYTRGRERSRDVESILREVRDLRDRGFKEVTLLGQNVNSYKAPLNPPVRVDSETETEEKIQRSGGRTAYKTASPDIYKLLEVLAKKNRQYPTEAEKAMWELLKGNNLGVSFRRQHIIGDYIVDFVCLQKDLIIEIDGGYHAQKEQKIYDEERTASLRRMGFDVIRFSNEEVIADTKQVLKKIQTALQHSPITGGDGGGQVTFPQLLRLVARAVPEMRVRFTTSHPKDMSDETLKVIAEEPNVCRHIHLPVQSGSNDVLKRMNRKYTREWYLDRVAAIRRIIPDCGLSTDIFAGYCGETEEDHQMSLSLMRECQYDSAFMFKYSERPATYASKHLKDDVPEEVKIRRLNELIALQNELSAESNRRCIGKEYDVLLEGVSKRSRDQLFGRTEQNKVVIVDRAGHHIGETIRVRITDSSSATLKGETSPQPSPKEREKA